MGRRGYPEEFRRRVLDLIAAGRKVARGRATISGSASRRSTRGDDRTAIDRGLEAGSVVGGEGGAGRGTQAHPRARGRARGASPGDRAAEGAVATQKAVRGHRRDGRRGSPRAARVPSPRGLGVRLLRAGGSRPPSPRAIRHAWLTDLIQPGPPRLPRHLRRAARARRAHPRARHLGRCRSRCRC